MRDYSISKDYSGDVGMGARMICGIKLYKADTPDPMYSDWTEAQFRGIHLRERRWGYENTAEFKLTGLLRLAIADIGYTTETKTRRMDVLIQETSSEPRQENGNRGASRGYNTLDSLQLTATWDWNSTTEYTFTIKDNNDNVLITTTDVVVDNSIN